MTGMNKQRSDAVESRIFGGFAAGLSALIAVLCLVAAPVGVAPAHASALWVAADEGPEELDEIIFRSGRTVRGEILEQTDREVKIRVIGPGGLSVVTSYDRSEILEIGKVRVERDEQEQRRPQRRAEERESARVFGDGEKLVYLAELSGNFGRDVSATPLQRIVDDARRDQPDILLLKIDCDFDFVDPDSYELRFNVAGYRQLETARQISTIITDGIRDDPRWEKKPRLVFWVNRAMGGAAFLPFVGPEIYFTRDGRHGGIGYLEKTVGSGDEEVREKMFSAQLGIAEGLANKGGHDYRLVRAMSRSDYVLSVSFAGGRPVFHERMPDGAGELLLTNDPEEHGADSISDIVRFRGRNVLMLDADMAYRLGLSRGTADTLEDLMFEMGVARGFTVVDGRADRIQREWSRGVRDAELTFRRLWREFNETPVQGDYTERTRARGRRIQILEQIQSLLNRFGEAIDPQQIGGAPENWDSEINIMLETLRQEQRLDRRD